MQWYFSASMPMPFKCNDAMRNVACRAAQKHINPFCFPQQKAQMRWLKCDSSSWKSTSNCLGSKETDQLTWSSMSTSNCFWARNYFPHGNVQHQSTRKHSWDVNAQANALCFDILQPPFAKFPHSEMQGTSVTITHRNFPWWTMKRVWIFMA